MKSKKLDTTTPIGRAEAELRHAALAYPDAYEEFPWGERALKVKGKVFVFLSQHEGGLNVTVKLPRSGPTELLLPFASPTGYGLGKSGWVTARFGAEDDIPLSLLCGWIDESYRAIAPKTLVAKLPSAEDEETAPVERKTVRKAKSRPKGNK